MDFELMTEKNNIIVKNIDHFHPKHIFECGQCFRWIKKDSQTYLGVVKNKVMEVQLLDSSIKFINCTQDDYIYLWKNYFDLFVDYNEIKKFCAKDLFLEKAIHFGHGIRLLNQELEELIFSFILSANNRIPRIIRTIDLLSKRFGNKINYNNETFHSFPSIESLANASIKDIEECKAGYRSKYIIETAKLLSTKLVNLETFSSLSSENAKKELLKLPGVGNKVADCILLFSGFDKSTFPTDVWIKKTMESLYFKKETPIRKIHEFASQYFGEYAGYAQQYLFYFARENPTELITKKHPQE